MAQWSHTFSRWQQHVVCLCVAPTHVVIVDVVDVSGVETSKCSLQKRARPSKAKSKSKMRSSKDKKSSKGSDLGSGSEL